MTTNPSRFAESVGKHDHRRCVVRALAAAEQICKERKLRLTPLRRRVFELILRRHASIGAYDILGALKKAEGALEPPTVYRALQFLQDAGLIHRIDSLNAFIACESPLHNHFAQFLVCQSCNKVTELISPDIGRLLIRRAADAGFKTAAQDIEIKGLCETCDDQPSEKN
jgi:Fur family transcriptional regulator, zinc uptake regulator